ncbi:hypothetical protein CSUI_003483 [Cystoisospora suis]|uniref:Uncharacterized protein n=1 Tax=Cystoisospora suis TaxID=483139 RepID=A0A2C6L455_9APIC|nr:hypothetical protein CSUI_003483 [Cystoisospora suis]
MFSFLPLLKDLSEEKRLLGSSLYGTHFGGNRRRHYEAQGSVFLTGGLLLLYSNQSTPSPYKTEEVAINHSSVFVYSQTNMESVPSSSRVGGNNEVSHVSLEANSVEKAKSRREHRRALPHKRASSSRSLSRGKKFLVTAASVVSLIGVLVALGRFMKCRAALSSSVFQSRGGLHKGGASARRLAEGGEEKDSGSPSEPCKSQLDTLLESLGVDTSKILSSDHGGQQGEGVNCEKEERRKDEKKAGEASRGGTAEDSMDQELWRAKMKHKEKLAELRFYSHQLQNREKRRQRARSQEESALEQRSSKDDKGSSRGQEGGAGDSEDSDDDWPLRMRIREKEVEVEFYKRRVDRLEQKRTAWSPAGTGGSPARIEHE